MSYAVKEIFLTLQGEGAHAGRAAVFCRFSGCNLWSGREQDRAGATCKFCDTDFVGTDGTLGGRYATSDDDTLSNNRQVLSDTITDFTHGTDHIQLEYVPTTILTGVEDSVVDALGEGHVLMTQHGGTHEVAAMQFGADTYLISSGDGGSFVSMVAALASNSRCGLALRPLLRGRLW